MHKVSIPQEVIDRIIKRRGHLHAFRSVPAAQTAMLVIDMQNAYMAVGAPAEIPTARAIVTNVNLLAERLRNLGGTIVWVLNTFQANSEEEWSSYFSLRDDTYGKAMKNALLDGSDGHSLWQELDVHPKDWHFKKYRYSAFAGPQGNKLDERLRAAGIEYLLIVGTATNICCESTARDAMMRNFRPIIISDATATRSDQEQVSALINVLQSFGDVYSTNEMLNSLIS